MICFHATHTIAIVLAPHYPMRRISSFPNAMKFWQALKRRVRQIGILIVSLWLFDLTLEHTLMYWRANVFAANLCHALESKEYREVTSAKRVKIPGARPFGPFFSELFRDLVNNETVGWAEGECEYKIMFGETFLPWNYRCKGVTYNITVGRSAPGFLRMRIKYNLLGNFLDSRSYDHTDLLDLYVMGVSGVHESNPWRYPIYLTRFFLCHPL